MVRETLSHYVRRVMRQQALNARDVERNSGKKIDNSYISKIINGTVTNLTANAIVALADGLKVSPHELFAIVSGQSAEPGGGGKVDSSLLVDLMQMVVADPELAEVLQEWVRLSGEDKARMLESLRFINEENGRGGRGKEAKGGKRQGSSG